MILAARDALAAGLTIELGGGGPRSEDPRALADALNRLLDDTRLRASMSRANRAKVAEFAPGRVARSYLRALEDIVGARDTAAE